MSIENKLIVLVLILPIILFFSFILYYDKTEKEPFKKLLLGMLYGLITLFLSISCYKLIALFNTYANIDFIKVIMNIISIIIVGFIVEVARFVLFYILSTRNKNFDELYDGIVYALSMMLTFATTGLVLYIIFIDSNNVNFINLFAVIPTQIFTAIMMGYYMSIAVFTKSKERKCKKLTKALFETTVINCLMYVLLVNQHYLYAYSVTMYYVVVVLAFVVEIVTACIALRYLRRLHKLNTTYESDGKYSSDYSHLMTKKEFVPLSKKNKLLLDIDFMLNIFNIIKVVLLVTTISYVGIVIVGKIHFANILNASNLKIGNDNVPKVQIVDSLAKQISHKKYVDDEKIITELKYSSKTPRAEIDKYMNHLLLNGYNYTSKIRNYNTDKIFELTTSSRDKKKIIVIDIEAKDNGYKVIIEKRNGTIVNK